MYENNNVIKIENVSKIYKLYDSPVDRLKESLHPLRKNFHEEFYALKNVSFDIKQGETVGIIGKNGSGKSTLLKIITGILNASSGTVEVNGKISALLELGAGFNPELSGIENIYFSGMIMGYSKTEIDKKIDEIVSFADIGEHIYQPVKTYSSGMFVRVAFALAININPEILIIDEALSVGDVKFQQKAIRKMKEIMVKSKAIIFVSHDMESIKNFCTKVVWIKDGQVYKIGEPKKIIQWYYNYMLHDILPSDEERDDSIEYMNKNEDKKYQGIQWEDVVTTDVSGDGRVEISSVVFYEKKNHRKIDVLNGEEQQLVFLVSIKVKENVPEPLVGFGIFNRHGIPIIHYNNFNINKKIRPFRAGEDLIVKFEFSVPKLQNGTYTISVGIDDGIYGEHTVVCRANECYLFKVGRTDLFSRQHGTIIVENAKIEIDNA